MDVHEYRKELKAGRLSAEEALDAVLEAWSRAQAELRRLRKENERLRERLAQYEPEAAQASEATAAQGSRYSLQDEERRRRKKERKKRKKKRSPGRRPTEMKFAEAEVVEDVRPPGVADSELRLARQRVVWRLRDGRAVRVGYRLFDAPGVPEPRIEGVTPRCEYGIEVLVSLAFLVYIIGISQAKACQVMEFFCGLSLSKSQADALLRQLGSHWKKEFDALCELLLRAAVVYMDETGWKVGTENCSLWGFASDAVRLFIFGCRKNAQTLEKYLPADLFEGIGVSDDAAVYGDRFVYGQKCWAHLLRKAIRLALLYPRKRKYKKFLDGLLELYRDAKRAAADKRLGEKGRSRRVAEFEGRLCGLCDPHWKREPAEDAPAHERDFYNLTNELVKLVIAEELFTFVLFPEVEPTNNGMERDLRNPALDRGAGRTNKKSSGAVRRSVIVSVLETLRASLAKFTLAGVIDEAALWMADGVSRFERQLAELVCPDHSPPAIDSS